MHGDLNGGTRFVWSPPTGNASSPVFHYAGEEPNGFMPKQDVVEFVEDYAKSFNAPVKEGVEVYRVKRDLDSQPYRVSTSIGEFTADSVVVATGGYHTPNIPRVAERLPAHIAQLHSSAYKNPTSIPEGAVLVVGVRSIGLSNC